jgi:hypothetical protein
MNRQFFALVAVGVLGLATICVGQDEAPETPKAARVPVPPVAPIAPMAPHAPHSFEFYTNDEFTGPMGNFGAIFAVPDSDWSKVEKLTSALGEAKDDKQKTALTDKLKTAVDKCFDDDMKGREAELKKLQARLDKLKVQLEKRRKAKDEIVQLEVKVLTNEAAGLGFSHSAASRLHREIRKMSGSHGRSVINIEESP